MPDVLSQSEIDALLSAAGEGAKNAGSGASPPEGEPRYYDFLRPERAPSSVMRALADLYETAARGMGAALSAALRSPVDCRLRALDQTTWGEFVMALPNPTCFAVVEASEPGGPGLESAPPSTRRSRPGGDRPAAAGRLALEIGPRLLFPLIERLLGAPESGEGEVPGRPLTAIERRVASAVAEMVLGPVAEMFRRARPVELDLAELQSNPQVASMLPPAEMAAVATFEAAFGGVSGAIHLAVPFGEWGGVLGELAASNEELRGGTPAASAGRAVAAAALARAPVRVEAIACSVLMPIRELARLSAGHEFDAGLARQGEITVTVAGRPKLRATEDVLGGRRAIAVTGRIGPALSRIQAGPDASGPAVDRAEAEPDASG